MMTPVAAEPTAGDTFNTAAEMTQVRGASGTLTTLGDEAPGDGGGLTYSVESTSPEGALGAVSVMLADGQWAVPQGLPTTPTVASDGAAASDVVARTRSFVNAGGSLVSDASRPTPLSGANPRAGGPEQPGQLPGRRQARPLRELEARRPGRLVQLPGASVAEHARLHQPRGHRLLLPPHARRAERPRLGVRPVHGVRKRLRRRHLRRRQPGCAGLDRHRPGADPGCPGDGRGDSGGAPAVVRSRGRRDHTNGSAAPRHWC